MEQHPGRLVLHALLALWRKLPLPPPTRDRGLFRGFRGVSRHSQDHEMRCRRAYERVWELLDQVDRDVDLSASDSGG